MGKVMKADATAAGASANFAFTAAPDVWITFRLGLTQAFLDLYTLLDSGDFVQFLALVTDAAGSQELYLGDPDGIGGWGGSGGTEFGNVPPAVAGWQTVEVHLEGDTLSELFVDATEVWSTTPSVSGNSEDFTLGLLQTVPDDPAAIVYFDDVKIGTTRGGFDIFTDDFEDETFDAWNSTDGDVSIVDDPFVVSFDALPVPVFSVAFDDNTLEPEPVWTQVG